MAISQFQKKVFVRSGVALALVGILVGLTVFMGADIGRRTTQLGTLRDETRFRTEAIESFVALRGEYAKAQVYFSLLENILPQKDRLLSFPKDVRALGKKRSLVVNFAFGDEVLGTATTPGHINFQMSIHGAFPNLLSFLDDLKSSSYFVDLSSLELVWGEKDVSATVMGKVFSR